VSTDDSGHSSRPSQVVVALPLLTPPPPICRRLSLRHCLLCLLSIRLVVPSPRFSRRHLPSASAAVIQLLAVTGSYWAVLVRWYLTTGIYNYSQ
jgi:hypothetical protein